MSEQQKSPPDDPETISLDRMDEELIRAWAEMPDSLLDQLTENSSHRGALDRSAALRVALDKVRSRLTAPARRSDSESDERKSFAASYEEAKLLASALLRKRPAAGVKTQGSRFAGRAFDLDRSDSLDGDGDGDRAPAKVSLKAVLSKLRAKDPEMASVIELRLTRSLTLNEIAAKLQLSEMALHRRWLRTLSWISGELEAEEPGDTETTG